MLDVVGLQHIVKNLRLISQDRKPYGIDPGPRLGYLNTIKKIHKDRTPVNFGGSRYIDNDDLSNRLSECFWTSGLDDKKQTEMIDTATAVSYRDRRDVFEKCERAIETIKLVNIHLYRLFDFCIHSIFTRFSNEISGAVCNAASTSNAIGVIFINNSKKLKYEDIVELLVHELTHCLMFIDEVSHKQFEYDEMIKRENSSRSAILDANRPLDKVVHSIVVSAQVLNFRRQADGAYDQTKATVHPGFNRMRDNTLLAIDELAGRAFKTEVMTPHTRHLLQLARASIH